jgi:hypothetical protein
MFLLYFIFLVVIFQSKSAIGVHNNRNADLILVDNFIAFLEGSEMKTTTNQIYGNGLNDNTKIYFSSFQDKSNKFMIEQVMHGFVIFGQEKYQKAWIRIYDNAEKVERDFAHSNIYYNYRVGYESRFFPDNPMFNWIPFQDQSCDPQNLNDYGLARIWKAAHYISLAQPISSWSFQIALGPDKKAVICLENYVNSK